MEDSLPVLMGHRILLREPREEDAAALFRHASDPTVTEFLAFDPPSSLEETLAFIRRCHEGRSQDREYNFAIAEVASDEPIGVTGLRHIDREMSTAQIGSWLARPWWGSGVNLEAKRLVLAFAFDTLQIHRIEARIARGNDRSRRAFEKLGAKREGLLRQSLPKRGEFLDTFLYAILADQWRAHSQRMGRRRSSLSRAGA